MQNGRCRYRNVKTHLALCPSTDVTTNLQCLIQPYFDYCSPLWDTCNKTLKDKLQKYQNRAARIIAGATYEIRSGDVLQALEWENLESRRIITKATLMYKISNDYSAPNLKQLLKRRNSLQTFYDLRNSQNDLDLPKLDVNSLKKASSIVVLDSGTVSRLRKLDQYARLKTL